MNKTINKFLLTGNKFMPEFHLKQPGFTYSKLDKACFAHDAAYSDSKTLAKRTISDKILKDRAYGFARNCKYDVYQRALAGMI